VRYVELNPVRAGVVERAEEYQWSSAAFHIGLREDKLLRSQTQWGQPMEEWSRVLGEAEDEDTIQLLRSRTMSGFPCGDEAFIHRLSEISGRTLILRGRGRPRKG
jgi:putative transposase